MKSESVSDRFCFLLRLHSEFFLRLCVGFLESTMGLGFLMGGFRVPGQRIGLASSHV